MIEVRPALLIAFILLSTLGAWAEGEVEALVCDLQGLAESQSAGGQWRPLSILDGLVAGELVRLPSGSLAQISLVEGGRQAQLRGPCLVRVDKEGFHFMRGEATSLTVVQPLEPGGTAPPLRLNIDKLGGLVRPKPARLPRWTTDAVVTSSPARLTWEAPESWIGVEVEIRSEGSQEAVFHRRFRKQRSVFVTSLEPGHVYSVLMRAWNSTREESDMEWEGSLETLSLGEEERLSQLNSGSVAERTVLLTHQLQLGLYTPALANCEELLKARPTDLNLKRIKKRLNLIKSSLGL